MIFLTGIRCLSSSYAAPGPVGLDLAVPVRIFSLCKVSSVHMKHNGKIDPERYKMMQKAREFFMTCYNAAAPYVAVENPLPMALANLPKPSCFIQPYWYGERYSKKTLFWLRNLPPLMPDCENPNYKEFVHSSRGLYRSRTFDGVAKAIAWQW